MDRGYQPGHDFPREKNQASASDCSSFSQCIMDDPSSTSMPPSPVLTTLEFNFPHYLDSYSFSPTPLVDVSIFDTPVYISFGALPPPSTTSRAISQGRIPRPRNAFMLFRSAFHQEKRLEKSVEKDHRHISRIIAHCWRELPETERNLWKEKAEVEKRQHALTYPEYRFKPTPRTKQPVRRNVRRNGPEDFERCKKIARLIQTGKSGEELTQAVKHMEDKLPPMMPPGESTALGQREERHPMKQTILDRPNATISEHLSASHYFSGLSAGYRVGADDPPPFRSPLLPPSDYVPVPDFKRSYSATASVPTNQLSALGGPSDAFHYPQVSYSNQGYLNHELDRNTKTYQSPPDGPQPIEWPTKHCFQISYDQTSPKQQLPESPHHDIHFPALAPRVPFHTSHNLGESQFHPSMIDWNTYYQNDAPK